MKDVVTAGVSSARHLRGDIYEVRAEVDRVAYRILFAPEGMRGHILLALVGYRKQTRRAPQRVIELAERRLAEWRSRAKGS
jgi:phage-related protein